MLTLWIASNSGKVRRMLKVASPFPQVGSYALLVDTNLPVSQQRAELVRVMRRIEAGGEVAVAFPLRLGACGNRIVPESELLDGTPLTKAEERELTDLQGHLAGRTHMTPALRKKDKRAHDLKARQILSHLLATEMKKLEADEARHVRRAGGSTGSPMRYVA
jgi:uncharacterized protein YgbK (DUF1537 family)